MKDFTWGSADRLDHRGYKLQTVLPADALLRSSAQHRNAFTFLVCW